MKACHVMFADKYVNEYIEFINKNFRNENTFVIFQTSFAKSFKLQIPDFDNVIQLEWNNKNLISLRKYFNKSEKIFMHGLFNRKIFLMLFLSSRYCRKINWIIWGGDLYYYKYRKRTLKSDIYEFVRKSVIKNLAEITTMIKGDYLIAKDIYEANSRYNYAFYPNPINFEFLDKALVQKSKKDEVVIQVGNSAHSTNEHMEILDILSKYKDKDIKIICPLSYGDKEYANKVIEYGIRIFSDKFQALTEYLLPEKYSKILANVDIAIFNHQRQQALGNIIGLLYLGKKVYIRNDITPWDYFDDLGIKLYNTIELKNISFENLINFNENIGQVNKKIIEKEFSEEHCVQLWRNVFYGGE